MKTIKSNIMNAQKLTTYIVFLVLFLVSGCSTIQFIQLEQDNESLTVNRWHHSTLNGMVEISKPLNIQSICANKAWATVTTEFTFYNALPVILVPQTPLVSFYSAWTNKVKCYETKEAEEYPPEKVKSKKS